VRDVASERHQQVTRSTQFIWLLFGIVEGLIALRVLLKLIGANTVNPFADFVYSLSRLFIGPFQTLTSNPVSDGWVLEVTSLIAMLVYALVGWAIVRLVWILFDRPSARSVSIYEREHR
jgi:hypothetical protein